MKSTPISPPAIVSNVICRQAGDMPQMNNAGMVNSTPDATDELAEPIVWDMLLSRIECRRPNDSRIRKVTTVSTATGIDVLIVKPALSPR